MPTFTHTPTGKKVFFAHIPRTAGRYVDANLLWRNNFTWDEIDLDTGNGVMTVLHGEEIAHWHKDLYEEHLNVKDIPNFSIVRNPVDRFISGSVYLKRLYGNDSQEQFEDPHLFFSMIANIPLVDPSFSANWFRSQVDFMTDRTKIWKYENGFGKDFCNWISDTLSFPFNIKSLDYTKVYVKNKFKKTKVLIDNIRKFYKKDFEVFKYV